MFRLGEVTSPVVANGSVPFHDEGREQRLDTPTDPTSLETTNITDRSSGLSLASTGSPTSPEDFKGLPYETGRAISDT